MTETTAGTLHLPFTDHRPGNQAVYRIIEPDGTYFTGPPGTNVTEIAGSHLGGYVTCDIVRRDDARPVLRGSVPAILLGMVMVIGAAVCPAAVDLGSFNFAPFVVGIAGMFVLAVGYYRLQDHTSTASDNTHSPLVVGGGTDLQARGLLRRISEATFYSTAGFDDDLWQAFFVIGRLIDEKKQLTSIPLAKEVYDDIATLVAELNAMITARVNLIAQRRELGLSLMVPGNETQRVAAGLAEEMEELAMRPLLRARVADIKTSYPSTDTTTPRQTRDTPEAKEKEDYRHG